jgi:predicted alpha/beta superfamily hydrolase
MKRVTKIPHLIVFSLISFISQSSGFPQEHPSVSLPEVTIPGTQSLSVSSSIVGEDFDLQINLPRGYTDSTRSFPVVYLLDGQWDFPLINAVYGEQYYDGFVPGLIVVGITWGGRDRDYDYLRARDLTPTKILQVPQSGNASRFLAFITKELVPFIEARYRTLRDDRTLMGSSLGGLFTLYALFQDSTEFSRFVLTSPAIPWDNYVIDTLEAAYAKTHSDLPAKVFMAVGGLEVGSVGVFQRFADVLRGRGYKQLHLETRVLDGMGHSGTKAEGFARGLQSVFTRPSLALFPEVLDQYVGSYFPAPEVKLEVTREGRGLHLYTPDDQNIPLHAASETEFYVKGAYVIIRFVKDPTGAVTGFDLEQYAGRQFIKKGK